MTNVVPNLRTPMPLMPLCAARGRIALPTPARTIHVMRWTFRRDVETVLCELGLNGDDLAYQLKLNAPGNPGGDTVELFDDVASAFERHAAIEKLLVSEGWLLEAFQSEQVAR